MDPVGDELVNGLGLFNQGDGFLVDDAFGGSWFNLFGCTGAADLAACADGNPAFAGTENRVLLAQLTANGEVYGILNVQVFVGGDQSVLQEAENLTFSSDEDAVFGCTVGVAENFNPDATLDDLSCVYTCTLALEESSVVAPTCNGENDGSLQVIATGAQGADYFFLDSIPGGAFDEPTAFGGQNFGNFSDELAGEYLVWVFDGAGCTASLLVTIPVTDPVAIELSFKTAWCLALVPTMRWSASLRPQVETAATRFTFQMSLKCQRPKRSGPVSQATNRTASSPLIRRVPRHIQCGASS